MCSADFYLCLIWSVSGLVTTVYYIKVHKEVIFTPKMLHSRVRSPGEQGGRVRKVLTDLMATQESLSNHRKHLASCRIRPLQVITQIISSLYC